MLCEVPELAGVGDGKRWWLMMKVMEMVMYWGWKTGWGWEEESRSAAEPSFSAVRGAAAGPGRQSGGQ